MNYNPEENKMPLCERFRRIQYAQRAMTPLAIQLLNEKRGIYGKAAQVDGNHQDETGDNIQDDEHNNSRQGGLTGAQRMNEKRNM